MSAKYVRAEDLYDDFAMKRASLMNYSVSLNLLRDDDRNWYNRFMNLLNEIGEINKRKRNEAQNKYRARRKQRLSLGLHRSVLNEN